jgi:GH15 family glucan-1,4-alpha-glucosidase
VGNAAAKQRQHDVFGEMVLALFPVYLDERFSEERSPQTLDLLLRLAHKAISVAGKPDAGIWEFRNGDRPQTFSSLMCWAAADRVASVVAKHRPELEADFRRSAAAIRDEIVARAWNPTLGSFASGFGGSDLDASLLQMASLRLLPRTDPRLAQTVDAVIAGLTQGGWLMRYRADDGFGAPTVAFTMCTFWLAEALAVIGRAKEARALVERACQSLSPLGLISEDYDVDGARMWGNYPQAYSHVGLINAAFSASPRWAEYL